MSMMYVSYWMTIDCRFELLHQRHYLMLSTTDDAERLDGGLVCARTTDCRLDLGHRMVWPYNGLESKTLTSRSYYKQTVVY
jgi:hypothetical protein